MTKLVHVTTVPQTLGFFTGQIGFMRSRGFEVHALCSPGAMLDRFCSREQVQPHAVEMPRRITPLRDMVALARMWRVFRRVRPDIVHAHTPKGGLLGMLAAAALRVPVRIFHLHGLPHVTARGLRRELLKWSTQTSCRLSHRVLCVSHSVRDLAISEALSPEWKISVPVGGSVNGVDAEGRFNPARLAPSSRNEVRARYGIPEGSIVMGFVGRLVREKGLVELAAAWTALRQEFPNVDWLLVGDFESEDPLPPRTLAQLRSDPRIRWTGWADDLPELYGAMDLLVLPSYREGFPVVLLEGAAMRLPIVSTLVPGCVDAVVHGETGVMVPPRDAEALAEAIRLYLTNAALRTRHGEAGRRRTLHEFCPEVIWHAAEAEYLSLLKLNGLGSQAKPIIQLVLKRALDVCVAGTGLVVLSPLLLLVALCILLTMGRPILFRQPRAGWKENPFTLLKFRTMTEVRDAASNPLPDRQRLTPLGRVLRRFSLDELPQLWNILKGELSFVGPRPLLMEYLPRYSAFQRRRHEIKPGLTGWAQVHGRNATTWERRFALDVWYVDHWSLLLDLRILALTIRAVLRQDGIAQLGHVTMPKFQGSHQ